MHMQVRLVICFLSLTIESDLVLFLPVHQMHVGCM